MSSFLSKEIWIISLITKKLLIKPLRN